ncbi:cytosolic tryparedoxin peroxidase, trypanosomatid typical 2-Cys peroxiredoxin [Phycisphaerales bacterium]|nr:cytosolic tryparedoxin peroxidase, trypanosomatid typical 2-Cys peroxiredoxin [Phycisphaerales bacterium]
MRNNLPTRSSPIAVGEIAPDFTLPDQNKKEWKLSDAVKQGDVVLSFVPFAFTGVCSTEMKCISADFAKWTAKGATVVGINCDSMFANKAWAEKDGYTHTILSDLHRDITRAFGLYWPDMNVSGRGTVVIAKSADGKGKVKFIQAREPGKAMNWAEVLELI